jgi:hypothetical protein
MQSAPVIEQEFLPLRAKLLEIGAALDRLERAEALGAREPRVAKIHAAIDALLGSGGDRAEQIQLVFSRPFEEGWRDDFGLTK